MCAVGKAGSVVAPSRLVPTLVAHPVGIGQLLVPTQELTSTDLTASLRVLSNSTVMWLMSCVLRPAGRVMWPVGRVMWPVGSVLTCLT